MFISCIKRLFQKRARARVAALSLCLAIGPGAISRAQTVELKTIKPSAKKDNPDARALFEEVANSYKALKSYSDKGEFILAFKVGGSVQRQVLPMKMTFARRTRSTSTAVKFGLQATARRSRRLCYL